jgi:putative ABC transport system permease protein
MHGGVPLARRNVFADLRKTVAAALGVGAAIGLVLFLEGMWAGILEQSSAYVNNAGAELFLADEGTRTLAESSVVPLARLDEIRELDGVTRADPVAFRLAILDLHGKKIAASVVGSRPGGLGGPWDIASGHTPRKSGEVVLDAVLAEQHDIGIGQQTTFLGRRFEVVGLSSGTRSWMTGYVFLTHDDLARLSGTQDSTNFILVATDHPESVMSSIGSGTGLEVIPRDQLAVAQQTLYADIFRSPLRLMVLIALGAGTLVIALTTYSAVVDRIREYGIARAMGARAGRLYRVIVGQTAFLAAFGMIAGFGLFIAGSRAVGELRPQFWVRLDMRAIVEVVVASGAMALLAAIFPTRRVARLDPASVYRSSS